ncbi:uncharacterized protein FIESC28_10490 [Fusarium coffeatum]|uniref:MGAT4 conserved region domain-containing protein n=1 Tax=Fusarium coffeatum TaxID=231269 RepID=A0A366QV68_9HYPO|nr:uncharacterized protein FIESC28_10490 [Fusarium coffeatum]RBR07850.1 hypothetical protein FIESC28_10490 [Fusarium coffeatum]
MLVGRNRITLTYAVLGTIWLFLFQLCRRYTYTDPSSFFYDPRRAYETRYTDHREREADSLIDIANHAEEPLNISSIYRDVNPQGRGNRLCVGIPSVTRAKQHFLPRTLGSLLEGLDASQRRSLHVIVLLADDEPTKHTAFGQTWLERLTDEVLVYNVTSPSTLPTKYRKTEPISSKQDKTTVRNDRIHRDYASLIANCRRTEADYFVLVEDDVIAARDWLDKLSRGLEHLERSGDSANWLYLRLFYSETYLGWNSEEWPIYLFRSLVFYSMVLVIYFVIVAADLRRWSKFHLNTHRYNLGHITFWTASFVILYFLAGRLMVDPYIEGIREMQNYGCCAQGLVIPTQHLPALEESLYTASEDIAGDSLIEEFADKHDLKKYAIVPSVLQHVGIKGSSDDTASKKGTWNFSFERTNS